MTKTEAHRLGSDAASRWLDQRSNDDLRDLCGGEDRNVLHAAIKDAARDQVIATGLFKTVDSANACAFIYTFFNVAHDGMWNLYNALPDVAAARAEEGFRMLVDHTIKCAEETITKFKEQFEKNPVYALEWSLSVFQAAADLDVATRVRYRLEAGATKAEVQKELVDSSRYMIRLEGSTSPTANLMEQAKTIVTFRLAGIKS